MNKLNIGYEITLDGHTHTGSVRILAADKIRFEIYARANLWPISDGPRSMAYLVYAALVRTHVIADTIDFDTFVENVLIDFDATPADEETPDVNPTQ